MSLSTGNPTLTQAGKILLADISLPIRLKVFANHQQTIEKILLQPALAFEYTVEGSETPLLLLEKWLIAYGKKAPFPVDELVRFPSGFQGEVLRAVAQIPFGETRSYQQIAIDAGSPRAARAVGTACKQNPYPILIPCHRVVPKGGTTGCYAYGSPMKTLLLTFENPSEDNHRKSIHT